MESAEYQAAMAANLALAMACKVALGMKPEEFTVRLHSAASMFRTIGKAESAALLQRFVSQIEKAQAMEESAGQGRN